MASSSGPFELRNRADRLRHSRSAEPEVMEAGARLKKIANSRSSTLELIVTPAGARMGAVVEEGEADRGIDEPVPYRNFDCSNYNTCLSLCAALDWRSFTCNGCDETINPQLLWRAYHRLRDEKDLAELCQLPRPEVSQNPDVGPEPAQQRSPQDQPNRSKSCRRHLSEVPQS